MVSTQTMPQEVATVPSHMLAAVYRGVNDVRVETVPVPEIGPGELLVKINTCGICGTDLKKIATGSHSAPRIFGHEMSGTVATVGEGPRDSRLETASWSFITSLVVSAITAGSRSMRNAPFIRRLEPLQALNRRAEDLLNTSG